VVRAVDDTDRDARARLKAAVVRVPVEDHVVDLGVTLLLFSRYFALQPT
jgi:hypothetical protein